IRVAPSSAAALASRAEWRASGAPMCAMTRSGPASARASSISDSRSASSRAGNSPVLPATNSPSSSPATNLYSARLAPASTSPSPSNSVGTAENTTAELMAVPAASDVSLRLEERGRIRPPEQPYRGQPDEPGQHGEQHADGRLGLGEHAEQVERGQAEQHGGHDASPVLALAVGPRHPEPERDPEQAGHDGQADDERVQL